MPAARIIVRDRARFSWIVLALLIVGVGAGGVFPFSKASVAKSLDSYVEMLRPEVLVEVGLGAAANLSDNDTVMDILGPLAQRFASSEPPRPYYDDHTVALVLDVAVGVTGPFRYPPEPGWLSPEPGTTELAEVPSRIEVSETGTHVEFCGLQGARILALAFQGPAGPELAGYGLVEGSWPGPGSGGAIEAAVSTALAEHFNVSPGDTLELLPGLRFRVTGVFEATRQAAILSPGGIPKVVHIIVDRGSVEPLAEAVHRAVLDFLREGGMAAALTYYAGLGARFSPGLGVAGGQPLLIPAVDCGELDHEVIVPGTAGAWAVSLGEMARDYAEALLAYANGSREVAEEYARVLAFITLQGPGSLNRMAISVSANDSLVEELAFAGPEKGYDILSEASQSLRGWLEENGVQVVMPPPPGPIPEGGGVVVVETMKSTYLVTVQNSLEQVPFFLQNSLTSPLTMMAMIIVVLASVLVGLRVAATALETVLSDLRATMALLVARGASNRGLARSLLLLLAATSASMGVAGGVVASLLAGEEGEALNAALAGGVVAVLTGLLAYRRARRIVSSISPVEAVRPVQAAGRGDVVRPRLSALLIGLSLASVAVGLYADPEGLVEAAASHGAALAALATVLVIVGFVFLPFTPIALTDTVAGLVAASLRLYTALARAAGRLAGRLEPVAAASSSRLRGRLGLGLSAPALALAIAFGGVLGMALIGSVRFAGDYYWYMTRGAYWSYDPATAGAVTAASATLLLASLVSSLAGLLALYLLYHRALSLVGAEIVVARARGASHSMALRLAASMTLPIGSHSLIAAVAGSLAFQVAVSAVARISYGSREVPVLAPPSPLQALVLLGLAAAALIIPLALAWRIVGGPLAPRLRSLRMG